MHYAVTKENSKGGYDIYNWHDDNDDMTDVSSAEIIGHVSKDGEIDADYINDELAFYGVTEALEKLGFNDKADEIKKEFFSHLQTEFKEEIENTKILSDKIIWQEDELKEIVYKELEKFLTYEYAADIFMDYIDDILAELNRLKSNQYEWLYFYDIHHAIGAVLTNKLAQKSCSFAPYDIKFEERVISDEDKLLQLYFIADNKLLENYGIKTEAEHATIHLEIDIQLSEQYSAEISPALNGEDYNWNHLELTKDEFDFLINIYKEWTDVPHLLISAKEGDIKVSRYETEKAAKEAMETAFYGHVKDSTKQTCKAGYLKAHIGKDNSINGLAYDYKIVRV